MNNVLKKQIFVSCIIFIAMLFTFIGNAEDIHFSKIQVADQAKQYLEVFKLCHNDLNKPYTNYFLGDYLYHGRKDIEQDQIQGKEFYKKAIPGLTALAEDGDIVAQYSL